MSRRFFVGYDGSGKAIIQQSKPSKDAKTGSLADMIFSSENSCMLVIGSGDIILNLPTSIFDAVTFQTAHGLSTTPDFVAAIARPEDSSGNAGHWTYTYYNSNTNSITSFTHIDDSYNNGQWATPYYAYWSQTSTWIVYQTSGYGIKWDATNIQTSLYCMAYGTSTKLHVKWKALKWT